MATIEPQMLTSDNINLQKQDLKNLDVSNLTPLSPEVISRQATINIGTIGHVAHGKSTVVKAISGVQTVRFKNELERNITIKLERISDQRIQALLKNRDLLREFERLQELKNMKRKTAATRRRQALRNNAFQVKTTRTLDVFTKPKAKPKRGNANSRKTNQAQANDYDVMRREETPSSGYESSFEVSSIISGESNTNNYNKHLPIYGLRKSPNQALPLTKTKQPEEYVIESIESVESRNGEAVFNVKWLGYSAKFNTWEPLENVKECQQLEDFVQRMTKLHHRIILRLQRELNGELRQGKEQWKITPQCIAELDKYDPVYLKIHLILWAQFVLTNYRTIREIQKVRKQVLHGLTLEYFYNKRKEQLLSLSKWENKMNQVERAAPVHIENTFDLDILDTNFQYIKNNFIGNGLTIVNQALNNCNCRTGCSTSSNCCARKIGHNFAYDKNGHLRLKPGEAIYECNENCSCSIDCPNRVIQRGRKNSLCLFKTSDGRGWGVRTDKFIHKGEYVAEYIGEIITTDEADERGKRYDAIGLTYLFDLDYDIKNLKYTIDAANFGNITHFFNHSCDPNLGVYPFWIDHLNISLQRIAFFTLRHINAGEELTFDYTSKEYENFNSAGKIPCRCGAKNCRKVLF